MTIAISGTNGITLDGQFNSASSMGFKNRLINSAMVIDQRNAGASVSISGGGQVFGVDRWAGYASGGGVFSAQQSTTAPAGFKNSWLATVTTADASVAAGDYYMLEQNIEGLNVSDLDFGLSSASTVTLSFWVRSSLTGTYSGGLLNSAANRAYPFTYSISSANTWEQKSVTITGDTSGTWLTTSGIGLRLRLSLGSGSTWQAAAGSWAAGNYFAVSGSANWIGTISNNFYITGVQLEKGSTATSFDYRPYGTELALCQRYYYRVVSQTGFGRFGAGYNQNTTASQAVISFPVTMRTNPTALEQSGTAADYAIINLTTATTCSAVPIFNNGTNSFSATVTTTVASGLTAGNGVQFSSASGITTAYLGWSAEL
jgi:hypothetical protein